MSENKSRITRYAKLRQELIDEQQHTIETKELSKYANQLNKLDKEHFKRMDIEDEEEYQSPLFRRNQRLTERTSEMPAVPRFEKDVATTSANDPIDDFIADETVIELLEAYEPEEMSDDFNNTYVDEVIREVKRYNVDKGYRKQQDTHSNVISNVLPKTDEYLTLEAIEQQLRRDQNLPRRSKPLNEWETEEVFDDSELENIDETIKFQVEHLAQLEADEVEKAYVDEAPTEVFEIDEITEPIVSTVDEPDSSIETIQSKSNRSNRLLNVLLSTVVILLILVIAAIIYVVLQLQ